MRSYFGQFNEVVPVAGHQQKAMFVSELEHRWVGGVLRKNLAQARNLVVELLQQVAQVVWDVLVEQESHGSCCAICRATSRSISPLWSS